MMTAEHRELWMREALLEAERAYALGEVPVGCVIVHNGRIIARGFNRREQKKSPLSHAETEAISGAAAALSDWRLSDTALFVTLEPCPMCAGAIINARIPEVYFGARDPAFGACGSVLNLFEERFGHHPTLIGGILEDTCSALMSRFFKQLR